MARRQYDDPWDDRTSVEDYLSRFRAVDPDHQCLVELYVAVIGDAWRKLTSGSERAREEALRYFTTRPFRGRPNEQAPVTGWDFETLMENIEVLTQNPMPIRRIRAAAELNYHGFMAGAPRPKRRNTHPRGLRTRVVAPGPPRKRRGRPTAA